MSYSCDQFQGPNMPMLVIAICEKKTTVNFWFQHLKYVEILYQKSWPLLFLTNFLFLSQCHCFQIFDNSEHLLRNQNSLDNLINLEISRNTIFLKKCACKLLTIKNVRGTPCCTSVIRCCDAMSNIHIYYSLI